MPQSGKASVIDVRWRPRAHHTRIGSCCTVKKLGSRQPSITNLCRRLSASWRSQLVRGNGAWLGMDHAPSA